MQKFWCAMAACGALAAHAAGELSAPPGIPAVAIVELRALLATDLPPEQRREASRRLAEAHLAAGIPAEALGIANALPEPLAANEIAVKARALAALGDWERALSAFDQLAAMDPAQDFAIQRAECLAALDQSAEAISILEGALAGKQPASTQIRLRLADLYLKEGNLAKAEKFIAAIRPATLSEEKHAGYLRARLMLARGLPQEADAALQALLVEPRGLSAEMVTGIALAGAEARLQSVGPEGADDLLEAFISQHPASPLLDAAFKKLDDLYALEKDPERGELVKWTKSPPPRRAALANLYLAKAEHRRGRKDLALGALERFLSQNPEHPLLAEGWLLRGGILGAEDADGALDALDAAMRSALDDETRAQIDLAAARLRMRRGEHRAAARLFRNAAGRAPWALEAALFESARAWLRSGEPGEYFGNYKELSAAYPESELRQQLALEQGLLAAQSGAEEAEAALKRFIGDFPGQRRAAEARIALAELAFLGSPQDLKSARRYLRAANTPEAPDAARARADYLAIFIADAAEPRDSEKVIAAARLFLEQHPQSEFAAAARMKLGQLYFRGEQFPSAQTQLETLAREEPGSPLAEPALFLSGQAAVRAMNAEAALDIFEEVARRDGPLKHYARQEQAIIKKQLGSEPEAVVLYDSILGATPPPDAELRFAALNGKGDSLAALGRDDPAKLEEARAVYDQLAADPDAPLLWRNQALYKKGKMLEKLGRAPEALAAWHAALIRPDGSEDPEYFWSYKAGFDAAQALEQQKDWASAIGIYQTLAALGGPRAGEAKKRLTQLRLEHFIWED